MIVRMNMDKLKEMPWPFAAVLITGGICFTAIVLWGPPDIKVQLVGANGIVWAAVAYFLESPRSRSTRLANDRATPPTDPPPRSGDAS
jgi:hypothetical protein